MRRAAGYTLPALKGIKNLGKNHKYYKWQKLWNNTEEREKNTLTGCVLTKFQDILKFQLLVKVKVVLTPYICITGLS
jgi:hypothetical protein